MKLLKQSCVVNVFTLLLWGALSIAANVEPVKSVNEIIFNNGQLVTEFVIDLKEMQRNALLVRDHPTRLESQREFQIFCEQLSPTPQKSNESKNAESAVDLTSAELNGIVLRILGYIATDAINYVQSNVLTFKPEWSAETKEVSFNGGSLRLNMLSTFFRNYDSLMIDLYRAAWDSSEQENFNYAIFQQKINKMETIVRMAINRFERDYELSTSQAKKQSNSKKSKRARSEPLVPQPPIETSDGTSFILAPRYKKDAPLSPRPVCKTKVNERPRRWKEDAFISHSQ